MKKKLRIVLLIYVFAFCICSCAIRNDGAASLHAQEAENLEGNFVDSYRLAVHGVLEAERGEEEAGFGFTMECLGMGRSFRLINYYLDEGSYSEIIVADFNGVRNSVKRPFDESGMLRGVGHVACSSDFLTLSLQPKSQEGEARYFLERRGEDGGVTETLSLDFLMAPEYQDALPVSIAADGNGYIHLVMAPGRDAQTDYCIVSSEGDLLWVKNMDTYGFVRLLTLPDGRIAIDSRAYKNATNDEGKRHHRVEWTDVKSGEGKLLFEYDESDDSQLQMVSVFNEDKLVYVTDEGVFLCDYSLDHQERIFTWKQNGMNLDFLMQDSWNVSVDGDGTISLLAVSRFGPNFLVLEETSGEIREIELAVPPGCQFFDEAVAEFNTTHSTHKIVIRDDYDKTALLTRLTAGDGPVLVETHLAPFEKQTKLWEPLDEVYDEMGLLDDLNPAAIKMGSIDDAIYGIVTTFYVETLVTKAGNMDWDYDDFFKCMEDNDNLTAIVDNALGERKDTVAVYLFDHGVEDSFYVDSDSGSLRFDTDGFRKLLKLIDQYGPDDVSIPYVAGVKEGEVLCNRIILRKPEELLLFHELYGDDVQVAGFPRKDGAKSHLASPYVLAIRQTASESDKEAAKEFAKMLLSYEVQMKMTKNHEFSFSVRKDVLERQIGAVSKDTGINARFNPERVTVFLSTEPDNEKNARELKEILERSVPNSSLYKEYQDILYEEFEDYFSGEITADMLIDHLTNRVGLYLKEIR